MSSRATVLRVSALPLLLFVTPLFAFTGENDVTPRDIVPAHADDWRWSSGFGAQGTDATVRAIRSGTSGLYATGEFQVAGSAAASFIARWDGQWFPLGDGLDVGGYSLAVAGDDVYVGGGFTTAGGVPAYNIARWDGTNWSALGPGLNGLVLAVGVVGNLVYAGGQFHRAGDLPVGDIAVWNGTEWSNMGGGAGPNSIVNAIATNGADVYVGGGLTSVGGMPTSGIAKWNGSEWELLGDGLEGSVNAITMDGNDVYACHTVVSVYGTVVESWVKKWDGSEWTTVGVHLDGSSIFEDQLTSLSFVEDELFVGGLNSLWKLEYGVWVPLPVAGCLTLSPHQGQLYVGGYFSAAGSMRALNIARFDGSALVPVAGPDCNGLPGEVNTIAIAGNDAYVGGNFGSPLSGANHVVRWDGAQWTPIGSSFDGEVLTIAVRGTEIFAGGEFSHSGNLVVNRIARWDGSRWGSMGGASDAVRSIVVWKNEAYAAGGSHLNNVLVNGVGRWDGTTWHSLGGGVSGDMSSVFTLAAGEDALYAGGRFLAAGGVTVNRIAKWDGTSWSALGPGLSQHPFTIAVDGELVYAAGVFNVAGGVTVNGVAMWDGTEWHALGSGLSLSGRSSVLVGHDLFVGGSFSRANGQVVNNVARWDGTQWHSLGGGVRAGDRNVLALAATDQHLYVGGEFRVAGDKGSMYFGKWSLEQPVPVLIQSFDVSLRASDIQLSWRVSHDGELESYRVYRGEGNNGRLALLRSSIPLGTQHYVDTSIRPGTTYRYVLAAVDRDGNETLSSTQVLTTPNASFALYPNVPNPFNPSTTIHFSVPSKTRVTIRVHDVAGSLVAELLNQDVDAGDRSVTWNGRNQDGSPAASGTYFVRLRAGSRSLSQKIVLLK